MGLFLKFNRYLTTVANFENGIVWNLIFELLSGFQSIGQDVVFTGPGICIDPIQTYLFIISNVKIVAKFFNGIWPYLMATIFFKCLNPFWGFYYNFDQNNL